VLFKRDDRTVVLDSLLLTSGSRQPSFDQWFSTAFFCLVFASLTAPFRRYLRPDFFNDGHLHVYVVYPHDSSQREALYGPRGLVTDEQVKKEVDQGGLDGRCPQLEVVFV
jgi:hypothetical protein